MGELALNHPAELPAAITPATMLQMAVQQGADLDKLEKLMDLQERWESNQALKSYTIAMSAFRADCPSIVRTRKGHTNNYAGLAETIDQIKNVLARNGLSHNWGTSQDGATISVTCTVTHVDGHGEHTTLAAEADGTGSKNKIQAMASTVSYLERYTLFAILGLASQEMDNDGAAPDTSAPDSALAEIASAQNMEQLQMVFQKYWKSNPAARQELTTAKDERKQVLAQEAEEIQEATQ